MLLSRYTALGACLAGVLLAAVNLPQRWAVVIFAVALCLLIVGILDLFQTRHSVRRNYPIIGRLRWAFEKIRPEIRQYLIESDDDRTPFSRAQRSLVYARAKNESSDRAFGTLVDVYDNGYEFIAHSTRPANAADPAMPASTSPSASNCRTMRPRLAPSASLTTISRSRRRLRARNRFPTLAQASANG